MPMRTAVPRRRAALTTTAALTGAAALLLAGCSADAGFDADAGGTVTLIVHDSFPNEAFAEAASAATGYDVEVVGSGDGGELANQLVLTQGAPLGDAFFGVDQIFASRVVDADVAEDYVPEGLPEDAAALAVDGSDALVPIDRGATCFNIDPVWFADQGIAAPETYEDLLKPEYRELTVLLDPAASSTGASFLVGTVAYFGADAYADYWSDLVENGARVEQGWSDAYYGQFTQGGEGGTRPIVLSYSSSPAATIADDGSSTSAALLDTCSSQVEYAGVLEGAENPEGARAVVDYLLSGEFQDTIAETMYMYPVDPEASVPEEWEQFAPLPEEPHDLPSDGIAAGLTDWQKAVADAVAGAAAG